MTEHELIASIRRANDDYHEAVEEIMQDNGEAVSTETKAQFAAMAHNAFNAMDRADKVIKPYYDPPEEE